MTGSTTIAMAQSGTNSTQIMLNSISLLVKHCCIPITEGILHHLFNALEIDPEHGQAHRHIGTVFLRQDEPQQALKHLLQAIAVLSPDGNIYDDMAMACLALEFEDAVYYHEKAIRLEPLIHHSTHTGLTLSKMGHIHVHSNVIYVLCPLIRRLVVFIINIGNLYREHDQTEHALCSYRNAINVEPDYGKPRRLGFGKFVKRDGSIY